jgi:hypothetical protein
VVSSLQASQPKWCMHPSPSPCAPHAPAHLILLALITLIILGEEYKPCSSSLCSFLQPPGTSSLLGPNILLSTLFSNTINLCSARNVRDQVSHPYKTTGKSLCNDEVNILSRFCNRLAIRITTRPKRTTFQTWNENFMFAAIIWNAYIVISPREENTDGNHNN